MVVNTHYKFIFVHVPKAAGTSMMKCLQKANGNKRCWLGKTKHETLADFYAGWSRRRSLPDFFVRHQPETYFTFGFVRNPWDRMSSLYHYLHEKAPRSEIAGIRSFEDFLIQARDGVSWIRNLHSMRSQLDFFTFPDRMMRMDFLGHYEHLEADIASISNRIQFPITLPNHNRSGNRDRDYRQLYNNRMIEIVRSLFQEEIDLFGYEFSERQPRNRSSDRIECPRRIGKFSEGLADADIEHGGTVAGGVAVVKLPGDIEADDAGKGTQGVDVQPDAGTGTPVRVPAVEELVGGVADIARIDIEGQLQSA
jgi:hypothetical protein